MLMLLRRNDQMLAAIAMGDAYAAAAEFIEKHPDIIDARMAEILKFERYLAHPFHKDLPAGSYTDDTEMSVANARVLIEHDYPFMKLQFADAYLREFNRGGKRKGYAGGFYNFLSSVLSGTEFLDRIRPDSDQNGAAMRAVPIGILPTVEQVLQTATLQASVTHDTKAGVFSARAIALMSHFALRENPPMKLIGDYLVAMLPNEDLRDYGYIFQTPWDGGPVTKRPGIPIAITTVHAVLHLLKKHYSFLEVMKHVIEWKGDTDSVAAIAWGIMSARYPINELPDFMYRDLEQGKEDTGLLYLDNIGVSLCNKYC